MRPIITLVIFSIVLFSCTKKVEYKKFSASRVMLTTENMHIKEVKVIDWKVGPNFKQLVSKGLRIKFSLPILENDDLGHMSANTKANAWILRLIRKDSMRTKVLGQMYIPLTGTSSGKRRSTFSSSVQQKAAHFEVFYAAAAPSKRFEGFSCPAFNHNKTIEDIDIMKTSTLPTKMMVSLATTKRVRGKSKKFGFRPALFNGGMKLAGTYRLAIAAYDYVNKVRRSDYVLYPEEVKVYGETSKTVKGCGRFKIPKREIRRSRAFKFSR